MSYGTAPAWPRNGGRAAARRWCCCTRASRPGEDGRRHPFSHLDDLLAVPDHADAGPVRLAGASAGGGLALDAALAAPAGSRAWR